MDDLGGIFLVLGLAREGKSVLWLSIGNLVDPNHIKHNVVNNTQYRVDMKSYR